MAVHMAYMDESGNTGRKIDPEQPLHVLATVVVPRRGLIPVARHLKKLASSYALPNEQFEFKGAQIFGGRGPWADVTPRERIRVYGSILGVIAEVEAKVIIHIADKRAAATRGEHPHYACLNRTASSLGQWQQDVVLVCDDHDEYRRVGLCGEPLLADGSALVEPLLFASSHGNWALQLADCVAYIVARRELVSNGQKGNDRANKAILWMYQDLVEKSVCVYDKN